MKERPEDRLVVVESWEDLLLCNRELSPEARLVALVLRTYTNDMGDTHWPGQSELAQSCNFDISVTLRALDDLLDAGFVDTDVHGSYWLTQP